jgi:ADP-ribosylglycohydrolase
MGVGILNEQDYYRIVYGGWLGKNIGGTLGAPVEGIKELLTLDFYPELPDGPLENDDLDLQLVWLHALEQYGPGITAKQLGQEWLAHVFFPFDEYGCALTNLRRGLQPPLAGVFNNPFNNCMGSPIRSEIWAMVAPGLPEQAAKYAYEDAIVDHAGGEGVYGEMFFAAIESAIFFEQDRDTLIDIGMRYIPAESRTAKALLDLLQWHKEGKDWLEARELILKVHGSDNFTDAPQNIAFTILGWLYGENFEDAILKAVNCGYDTDCTAATLGSILGMIMGPDALPAKWVAPVGDRIVVSPPINGFPYPKNLDELTRRTIAVGKQVLAAAGGEIIVHPELPTELTRRDSVSAETEALWSRNVKMDIHLLPEGTQRDPLLKVEIHYGDDEPSIAVNRAKRLRFVVTNMSNVALDGELSLIVPDGCQGPNAHRLTLAPGAAYDWETEVTAISSSDAAEYRLILEWTRLHDGAVWTSYRVPFTLVRAHAWVVSGPNNDEESKVWFPGNLLDFESVIGDQGEGWYRAHTIMHNPKERAIRLIAAATGPVKLKLNGTTVIDCDQVLEFMPAYHRGAAEQLYETILPAGAHKLEVEALRQSETLKLYVLPVATKNTQVPGPFYYLNDMRFEFPG